MAAMDPRALMWTRACELIDRAERLQRQFFRPTVESIGDAIWEPPVDIVETDSDIRIIVALPGVDENAVKVSVEADSVLVVGFRRPSAIPRGSLVHRLEIPYGRFERQIRVTGRRLQLTESELACGCLSLRFSKQPSMEGRLHV
ncbi:HSP20 family molecular chaperone IbpA [Bradyrhizobium elkanii]|uniref:Hsp20/alpha crystallin family protein n=1 Tax=Bradyrhizobium TaxID=374 RepID=UPI002166DCD2|nr:MULTISPECIES: Hsp20/alpha crystallin family protein [Bradyrhizobium]MCS3928953.1 HSP20 family molecular chaperone IbpA [Bradyrhizobium elkanii]MCS3969509.1 HSP20 family molecular chaperone IbpA [Bradyrhizobium japonicum]